MSLDPRNPDPDDVDSESVDQHGEPTSYDDRPRKGARERDVDKGPEEIGWVRWVILRPVLLTYFLLGLAFVVPLVIVSVNYGRVSGQNGRIAEQNQKLALALNAIQASREDGVRSICEANNAQNAAIFAVLKVFKVPIGEDADPQLALALKPLRPQNCDAAVRASKPKAAKLVPGTGSP